MRWMRVTMGKQKNIVLQVNFILLRCPSSDADSHAILRLWLYHFTCSAKWRSAERWEENPNPNPNPHLHAKGLRKSWQLLWRSAVAASRERHLLAIVSQERIRRQSSKCLRSWQIRSRFWNAKRHPPPHLLQKSTESYTSRPRWAPGLSNREGHPQTTDEQVHIDEIRHLKDGISRLNYDKESLRHASFLRHATSPRTSSFVPSPYYSSKRIALSEFKVYQQFACDNKGDQG